MSVFDAGFWVLYATMEQIRLAMEAKQKKLDDARRTRTRFNPQARMNERLWPSPFNVVVPPTPSTGSFVKEPRCEDS